MKDIMNQKMMLTSILAIVVALGVGTISLLVLGDTLLPSSQNSLELFSDEMAKGGSFLLEFNYSFIDQILKS